MTPEELIEGLYKCFDKDRQRLDEAKVVKYISTHFTPREGNNVSLSISSQQHSNPNQFILDTVKGRS